MFVYYFAFIITILIQFIPVKSDKQYLIRVCFSFVPIFLIGALRADWTDYESYITEFEMAHSMYTSISQASEHSEIGYMILNSIIPTWRLFLIITSAFTCFGFGAVIYKCIPPKYNWLAFLLFFLASDKTLFFMYSGIRNALAISIMCISFPLIRDRKWLPYFLLTGLAMTLHTSAILFMPLAFLAGGSHQMTKKESWLWISIMIALQAVSLDGIFGQATSLISIYFDRYAQDALIIEDLGDTRSLLIRFVVIVFMGVFLWFMRNTELSKTENSVCRLALLYSISYLLGAMQGRLTQCYVIFFISAVCVLCGKWKQKQLRLVFLAFVIAYLAFALFAVFMHTESFQEYVPYKSII